MEMTDAPAKRNPSCIAPPPAKMYVHIQSAVVFHAGDCQPLSDQIFHKSKLPEFDKVYSNAHNK